MLQNATARLEVGRVATISRNLQTFTAAVKVPALVELRNEFPWSPIKAPQNC